MTSSLIETVVDKTIEKGADYAKTVGATTLGRVALRIAMSNPVLTIVAAGAAGYWYLKKHKQRENHAS